MVKTGAQICTLEKYTAATKFASCAAVAANENSANRKKHGQQYHEQEVQDVLVAELQADERYNFVGKSTTNLEAG